MVLELFNTAGYSRFLKERVEKRFPEIPVELEDEMEYANGLFRLRSSQGKILVPGGNYGAMSLTEVDPSGVKRFVGRTLVSSVLICDSRALQEGLCILAGYSQEEIQKHIIDDERLFSVYLTPEIERFKQD